MTFNPWALFGDNNLPIIEYGALDVPQLYGTASPGVWPGTTAEWVDLYWYGAKYKNTELTFTGEMTQQHACEYEGAGSCPGTDAAPATAWMSLWDGVDALATNGHVSWSMADQMLLDASTYQYGASTDVAWMQCAAGPPVCPIS
ncbi:MAG: hypothetical protein M0008_01780 [Actinomycetota bacterium]|jgi:hypothetical protein|nr:hypothetical protein [Actinomycetota bacterium]